MSSSMSIIGGADGPTAIFITRTGSPFFSIAALLVLALFYAVYLGKMLMQKRQGIQTDQMGKNKAAGRRKTIEILLKITTYAILPVQLLSILAGASAVSTPIRGFGLLIAVLGDAFFVSAVLTMKNSWRAGIAEKEQTEMVTEGIYGWSRNPAFLGFDLQYLGILLMFFSLPLALFTAAAMILLHLQILQEEAFLKTVFGTNYEEYLKRTARYFGRHREEKKQ